MLVIWLDRIWDGSCQKRRRRRRRRDREGGRKKDIKDGAEAVGRWRQKETKPNQGREMIAPAQLLLFLRARAVLRGVDRKDRWMIRSWVVWRFRELRERPVQREEGVKNLLECSVRDGDVSKIRRR